MGAGAAGQFFNVLSFLFGACCGSFFNVLVARLPRGISTFTPPSHCFSCGSRIRPYDNLPILSWLILRGRCRDCGALFSPGHLAVEAISGLAALIIYQQHGLSLIAALYFYLFGALLVSSLIDWRHRIIPDEITYSGVLIGLLAALVFGPGGHWPVASWVNSLGGALLGGGVLYLVAWFYQLLRGREGLGLGDVKLLAMLGALLGYRMVLPILLWSSLCGSLVGLGLIWLGGRRRYDPIPFGPFIAAGALLALLVDPLELLAR